MLRDFQVARSSELYIALKVSSSSYLKIERDEKDLSFVMALRICDFYKLSVEDFINLLDPEELSRRDLSSIKSLMQRERKRDQG